MRSLEDRLAPLGVEGETTQAFSGEQSGLRIEAIAEDSAFYRAGARAGDVLIDVDGEPFFEGGGVEALRSWLVRELGEQDRELSLTIRRGGKEQTLLATFSLRPF